MIVTLTTWDKRIQNIPTVLNSIYDNTITPTKTVLNLSTVNFSNKILPTNIEDYIRENNIEIIWHTEDNKVWKKLLPTLQKYPNELVLSIDDDFIYPNYMIEDFLETYDKYNGNHPISGNDIYMDKIKYHCGCASLTNSKFYKGFYNVPKNIMEMGADDVYYTFAALKNGYTYKQSQNKYFYNLKPYNSIYKYSHCDNSINNTIKACKEYFEI